MSTFTLAISCLTTSNLPWFMDLTFQVPMQYWSSQHWTLFPSPVRSTTGYCFCFVSFSSFFLELFLHWSPVAYWAPTNLGSSSFSVLFLPFHTVHGVLKSRILKWFAFPVSSGPCFVRTLHHDLSVLGALQGLAQSFIELDKAVVHVEDKAKAPHCSTLAWKILWTKEPDGLHCMESLRVGHDWVTSLSLFTLIRLVSFMWLWFSVYMPSDEEG